MEIPQSDIQTISYYQSIKGGLLKYQSKKYHEDEEFRKKRIKDTIANSNNRYATNPNFVEYRRIQNKKYWDKQKQLKLLKQQTQLNQVQVVI